MRTINKRPILSIIDHHTIMQLLNHSEGTLLYNRLDADGLLSGIKKAKLVKEEALPGDVVKLNATVHLEDKDSKRMLQLTVVVPRQANIKEKKISVMSPVGIALLGCRKGDEVKWRVPAGKKYFRVLDVQH